MTGTGRVRPGDEESALMSISLGEGRGEGVGWGGGGEGVALCPGERRARFGLFHAGPRDRADDFTNAIHPPGISGSMSSGHANFERENEKDLYSP